MKINEIIFLKFPNSDFEHDIVFEDNGDGQIIIKKWNVPGVPKPDEATLKRWEKEVIPVKKERDALNNRRMEYPPIGDQLDAMLKYFEKADVSNIPELEEIVTKWKNTKLKYPKTQA